jgi:hypothetical protein
MARATTRRAVKKAISLPADLARFASMTAREEGKSLSAVVQDAMRAYRLSRLREGYGAVQSFWSKRAKKRGILTEKDLTRYLGGKP